MVLSETLVPVTAVPAPVLSRVMITEKPEAGATVKSADPPVMEVVAPENVRDVAPVMVPVPERAIEVAATDVAPAMDPVRTRLLAVT